LCGRSTCDQRRHCVRGPGATAGARIPSRTHSLRDSCPAPIVRVAWASRPPLSPVGCHAQVPGAAGLEHVSVSWAPFSLPRLSTALGPLPHRPTSRTSRTARRLFTRPAVLGRFSGLPRRSRANRAALQGWYLAPIFSPPRPFQRPSFRPAHAPFDPPLRRLRCPRWPKKKGLSSARPPWYRARR